jgi:hypothetical protein
MTTAAATALASVSLQVAIWTVTNTTGWITSKTCSAIWKIAFPEKEKIKVQELEKRLLELERHTRLLEDQMDRMHWELVERTNPQNLIDKLQDFYFTLSHQPVVQQLQEVKSDAEAEKERKESHDAADLNNRPD